MIDSIPTTVLIDKTHVGRSHTVTMRRATAQQLTEKIRRLPPERIAEVEDFVDFLQARTDERYVVRTYSKLAERSFERVWKNPADAAYDTL